MDQPLGRRRFLGLLGAGATCAVAAACSGDDSSFSSPTSSVPATTTMADRARAGYVPPPGEWATVDPADVGWDAAQLQAAVDFAGERATRALVVVHDGKVIVQESWGGGLGFARDIASAQKGVVALLVGKLQAASRMLIDEPVATYLGPGWSRATREQEAPITVRHLLTMTSGLANNLTFEAGPGTLWRYNTNAYQQLPVVVEAVAGTGIDAVTRAELFDPIGVSNASAWRDRRTSGPLGVDPNGRRIKGLVTTAPDMARVGLVVQRDGMWGGRAVLDDPAYLAATLSSSQELNPSYGYLWWLNGKAAHVLPGPPVRSPGPLVPDAPADLVAALGKDDQKIYVSRSLDVVVTRVGANSGARSVDALSDFDNELWRRLVIAAPMRG
jgi:CubicO group peptidase (beta-lactamase class C family)